MKLFAKMTWVFATQKTKSLYSKGKYEEALKSAQKAYDVARETFGEDYATTIKTRYNLVLLNVKLNNLEEAEKHAEAALILMEKITGKNDKGIIEEIKALEDVYRKLGKTEKADLLDRRIDDILEKKEMCSTAELIQGKKTSPEIVEEVSSEDEAEETDSVGEESQEEQGE